MIRKSFMIAAGIAGTVLTANFTSDAQGAVLVGYSFGDNTDVAIKHPVDTLRSSADTLAANVGATAITAVGTTASDPDVRIVVKAFTGGSLQVLQMAPNRAYTDPANNTVWRTGFAPPSSPVTTAEVAVNSDTYFYFTVTPAPGYQFDTSAPLTLQFDVAKGSNSTTRGYVIKTSINGFGADLASADINGSLYVENSGTMQTVSLPLSGITDPTAPLTVRFYAYVGSGSGITAGVDFKNIQISGNELVAIPEPATLGLMAAGVTLLRRRRVHR